MYLHFQIKQNIYSWKKSLLFWKLGADFLLGNKEPLSLLVLMAEVLGVVWTCIVLNSEIRSCWTYPGTEVQRLRREWQRSPGHRGRGCCRNKQGFKEQGGQVLQATWLSTGMALCCNIIPPWNLKCLFYSKTWW